MPTEMPTENTPRNESRAFAQKMLDHLSNWFAFDPESRTTKRAQKAVEDKYREITLDTQGRNRTAAGNKREGD